MTYILRVCQRPVRVPSGFWARERVLERVDVIRASAHEADSPTMAERYPRGRPLYDKMNGYFEDARDVFWHFHSGRSRSSVAFTTIIGEFSFRYRQGATPFLAGLPPARSHQPAAGALT